MLALSMGGAYAHGKIGSNQLKNNAVKPRHIATNAVKTADLGRGAVVTGKIKNRAVTKAKLHPGARPTVVVYTADGHDFGANGVASVDIPNMTPAQVANSAWSVQMRADAFWYQMPGEGSIAASRYRVLVDELNPGQVDIRLVEGPGENYNQIKVFRTPATVTGPTLVSSRRAGRTG